LDKADYGKKVHENVEFRGDHLLLLLLSIFEHLEDENRLLRVQEPLFHQPDQIYLLDSLVTLHISGQLSCKLVQNQFVFDLECPLQLFLRQVVIIRRLAKHVLILAPVEPLVIHLFIIFVVIFEEKLRFVMIDFMFFLHVLEYVLLVEVLPVYHFLLQIIILIVFRLEIIIIINLSERPRVQV